MAVYLSPPPAAFGSEIQQLKQLRSYLFRTAEALNIGMADMSAEGILEEIGRAVDSAGKNEDNKGLLASQNKIRSLIIKTADFAVGNSEEFKKLLKSEYSAVSDFGELTEKLENEITANAEGITQLFRYTSGIRSDFGDFSTESEQYIKTGLLYMDENGAPIYGVGVGNLSTMVTADGETVLDRQNLLTTTTADELAFWNGGQKIAYINGNMMYFPSGTLKAYEADISGKITATSGSIGGCVIENGVLQIGNANITSIDAGKITSGFLSIRNIRFDGIMDILGRESTSEEYTKKGVFGYELESFLSTYKGLLLESADTKQSMFLCPSRTWLMDEGNGKTKILYFHAGAAELVYDEDYDNTSTGVIASVELDSGAAILRYYDRDSSYGNSYISIEGDDIVMRFGGKRYYMSDIVALL